MKMWIARDETGLTNTYMYSKKPRLLTTGVWYSVNAEVHKLESYWPIDLKPGECKKVEIQFKEIK